MTTPKLSTKKKTTGWGGRRTGAGRKNLSGTVNHLRRARVSSKYPMHLTLRLKRSVPDIRRRRLHRSFQKGVRMAAKYGLRVIQYSIQTTHLHLIVEAATNSELERGMKSLAGRFGKIIRQYMGGKGAVFSGRFHVKLIKTPAYMKKALEYVLLNTAKHMKVIEHIDYYSSGHTFTNWRELLGIRFRDKIAGDVERIKMRGLPSSDVFEPQSWLARVGWLGG